MRFDFAVVGGGPAGSAAAALLARRGAKVALIESSCFEGFRAGEIIDRAAQRSLGEIGFGFSSGECGTPGGSPVAEWGMETSTSWSSMLAPIGSTWITDRRLFDQALFEHARSEGATCFVRSRASDPVRRRGLWHFNITSEAAERRASAPMAIEATGRSGRSCFAPDARRRWVDRLVGVAVVSSAKRSISNKTPTVRAFAHGWTYFARLCTGHDVNMLFTDADILAAHRKAFLRLLGGANGQTSAPRPQPIVFDARTSFRRMVACDGWCAIGDALIAIDPLAGRGVSEALKTAEAAVEWALPLPKVSGCPDWAHDAARRFNRYLIERMTVYAAEQRWAKSPFWSRRHEPQSEWLGVPHERPQPHSHYSHGVRASASGVVRCV